ncbi:MAG TPA: hypothetical protein VGI45_09055 [Terracidiphilus sp.]|jgi:hypothetical protein
MAAINVDVEIGKAEAAMEHAETALIESGFSREQWEMIRTYIVQAIVLQQWNNLKAVEDYGPSIA